MEKQITCNWASLGKTYKKNGKLLRRKCNETIVLRKGFGNFLVGVCRAGHLNSEKLKNA